MPKASLNERAKVDATAAEVKGHVATLLAEGKPGALSKDLLDAAGDGVLDPAKVGDMRQLPFGDGTFDAYNESFGLDLDGLAADHRASDGHRGALFLAEVYGSSLDREKNDVVREKLVRAVQFILHAQNEQGGWRYNPVPYDADVSVTICQIMGLRAARNAGIEVSKQTIDRVVDVFPTDQQDQIRVLLGNTLESAT